MTLTFLGWLFTIGVVVHNTEEAYYLPAWSESAGKWHAPVGAPEFRFAVTVLSVFLVAIAAGASLSPPGSIGVYLMTGYVLAMVLNVLMPHVIASVVMHKYMPGTATALLFNFPLGVLYLRQAFAENNVDLQVFYWAGPVVVLSILASIPVLFAVGRRLPPPAV
jgi:hypothetical protein